MSWPASAPDAIRMSASPGLENIAMYQTRFELDYEKLQDYPGGTSLGKGLLKIVHSYKITGPPPGLKVINDEFGKFTGHKIILSCNVEPTLKCPDKGVNILADVKVSNV